MSTIGWWSRLNRRERRFRLVVRNGRDFAFEEVMIRSQWGFDIALGLGIAGEAREVR